MQLLKHNASSNHESLNKKATPGIVDWFVVIILASFAFICFDQTFDMYVTMPQASDLISCLFEGKIFHFYSYIAERAAQGSYLSGGAAYNIFLYITMAVLAAPMYLLNKLLGLNEYLFLLNLWSRFLFIGFSIYCAHLITRISSQFTNDRVKAKWAGYFFLSSPIFMYCVIIQNQYDILSVTVILLALFFYFDKKYYKFAALMSLAICYKLFPVLVFFPLILLAEKRIGKLLQYTFIAVSPYIVSTLIYTILDPGYSTTQVELKNGFDFFGRIYAAQIGGGISNISIFMVLLILLCVYAYYIHPNPEQYAATAMTMCAASYANFFIFVEWHPQWFIIIMPFLILMIFSMKNFRLGVMLEIAVTATYLLTASLRYMSFYMMNNSLLVTLTSGMFTLSIHPNPLFNAYTKLGISNVPVVSLFAGSLIALMFIAYKDLKANSNGNPFNNEIKIERAMLLVRSLTILIYALPPVIYYLCSPVV